MQIHTHTLAKYSYLGGSKVFPDFECDPALVASLPLRGVDAVARSAIGDLFNGSHFSLLGLSSQN